MTTKTSSGDLLEAVLQADKDVAAILLIDALGQFLDDVITIYETQEVGLVVTDEK
jgi:hypothetical protein